MNSGRRSHALVPSVMKGLRPIRPLQKFATLRRSFGLLSDFRYEQTNPDIFYGHLADDTVSLLENLAAGNGPGTGPGSGSGPGNGPGSGSGPGNGPGGAPGTGPRSDSPLSGQRILDVGGGPGYFGKAFAARDVEYYTCEPDVGEMAAAGIELDSSVRGSGLELPFRDDVFDMTYSSNVAEHVAEPWRMAKEMLRVTKPGGLVVYSYTCWFGPFGGHEMGFTHYLGGDRARRMYEKKHGHRPKNYYGESLFEVGCAEGMDWARATERTGDAELLAAFPRYHPWWAWWMVNVPAFREVAVSNLVLVLRKR